MTTNEKATELLKDLGAEHAIYVTEEVLTVLQDWDGTELAQKDWTEIKDKLEKIKKDTQVSLIKEKLENNLENAKKYLVETN